MRRAALVTVWVLATLGAVSLARLAVGVVADQVDVQTASPLSDAAVREALEQSDAETTTTAASAGSTTPAGPSPSGSLPSGPGGPSGPTDSTETDDDRADQPSDDTSSGTSATTSPPTTEASSSTTTAPPAPVTRTYDLVGGSVSVRFSGGSTVEMLWASPAAGFEMDVRNAGPAEVDVEFESADHRSRVRARWRDGEPWEEIREDG